jgi:hypothetical protein
VAEQRRHQRRHSDRRENQHVRHALLSEHKQLKSNRKSRPNE